MKRLIIFTLLIFTIHSSYSQNVFNGIFDLRLGMTEKEIAKVEGMGEIKKYDDSNGILKQIFGNSEMKDLSIDKYIPLDGYIIKDIELKLYKDKIYKIRIEGYNARIERLLDRKYGKAKATSERMDNEKSKDARTNEQLNYDYAIWERRSWNTGNNNIRCSSSHTIFYLDTKQVFSTYELEIEDWAIKKELDLLYNKQAEKALENF